MRRYKNLLILTVSFALVIIFLSFYPAFQPARSGYAENNITMQQINDIRFYTSLDVALEKANSSGKPIFVYLRSKTCGYCKQFESESFKDPRAVNMIRNNFITLSIDVFDQSKLATDFKAVGTPTMVFLESRGREIDRIIGYVETDIFIKSMEKITGDK